MADFASVKFQTFDGVTLRGNFFRADGDGVPVVVMANGLSLLKEHFSDNIARGFRDAGFSVLLYDHRGFGASDGAPRHQVNPHQQADDLHDAISAAKELPGVDPARVGVHGGGHGGGCALIACADDPRVKAVIVNSPFPSGRFDAPTWPGTQLDQARQEREDVVAGRSSGAHYLQCWPETPDQAADRTPDGPVMAGEAAFGLYGAIRGKVDELGLPWENKITRQSLYYLHRAEPRDYVALITVPLLYLIDHHEPFAGPESMHTEIVASGGGNVQLGFIEAVYPSGSTGTPAFDDAMTQQVSFLRQHL